MATSRYAVVDPSTGDTLREYPTIEDGALTEAIGRADRAHRDWAKAPLAEGPRWSAGSASCMPSAARISPRSSAVRWVSPWCRRSARSTSWRESTPTTRSAPPS